MARKLITLDLCDDCTYHDIPNVTAVSQHVLSIDGGRPRRVLLCMRCEVVWEPIIAIYEQHGQDVDPPPSETAPKQAAKKRRPKAVASSSPKELEKAPEEERLYVVCPKEHPSEGGGKRRVAYKDRSSHVDQCHEGLKAWDIDWEDPDGILKFFCTEHNFCKHYGFTTERGVSQHINAVRKNSASYASTEEDRRPTEDR